MRRQGRCIVCGLPAVATKRSLAGKFCEKHRRMNLDREKRERRERQERKER